MMQSTSEWRTGRSIWPQIWLAFALIAAALVARTLYNWTSVPLFADTDDAMRFTVVRDLMAGQSWFDPVQHRLNTPFGAEIHWSRLIDLPIAGLILLLRPLAGAAAETLAVCIWPLVLLFGLLSSSAMITVRLVGRDGLMPALLLPAFSVVTMVEFAPGRIDHHSAGILLTLAMLYCSMEALTRPRLAIWAGIAAATALAVAIENLPSAAATIIAFGLLWAFVPGRADALRNFGLSFAAAALVHAALALPPDRWLTPACDALSVVYVAAAVGVGVIFVVLSLVPAGQSWTRLALGVVAGGALAGALVLAFPDCLRGPYSALEPWLAEHWIGSIREAVPLWESLAAAPAYPAGAALPALLALAVVGYRVRFGNREDRGPWLIYGLFLALAVGVMLIQVRGSRIAAELAVPAGAWLILAARRRYLARGGPWQIAGLVGSWLGFAGVAIAAFVNLLPLATPNQARQAGDGGEQRQQCLMESAFAGLGAMPQARIMSFVDLGAHILAFTGHSLVAAPYHRNQQGVRDALQFFSLPLEQGRSILEQRSISLVVTCPQMPEMRGLADAGEDSFVRLYADGRLPAWLIDRSQPNSPLKIYEVESR